jgi:hypothetical protein
VRLRLARCRAWVKRWSEAMDFLQTIFKLNISLVTESKGMLKTPEFDTSYDPVFTESKGMLKTPEFDASYDPVVTESKGMQKNLQNLTHHMTL